MKNKKKIITYLSIIVILGLITAIFVQWYYFKKDHGMTWLDLGQNICINIHRCEFPIVENDTLKFKCKYGERKIKKYKKIDFKGKTPLKSEYDGITTYYLRGNNDHFKYIQKENISLAIL